MNRSTASSDQPLGSSGGLDFHDGLKGPVLLRGWSAFPLGDFPGEEAVCLGQAAPSRIQCSKSAMTASGNRLPGGGGIFRSSICRSARINRLCSGWPGTMAGPESPPRINASRRSTRSPLLILAGPWHRQQLAARTGRIRASKNASRSSADLTVDRRAGCNRGAGKCQN